MMRIDFSLDGAATTIFDELHIKNGQKEEEARTTFVAHDAAVMIATGKSLRHTGRLDSQSASPLACPRRDTAHYYATDRI